MSVFHSTVTRRDFMKQIGLAGVGIGTAAAIGASFNDLDEVISNPASGQKYPWWVKQRPLENPTLEVDWNVMERFDASKCTNGGNAGYLQYVSAVEAQKSFDLKAQRYAQWLKDNKPGFTLRDRALKDSSGGVSTAPWTTPTLKTKYDTMGVPKWQGTPEENSRMLRSALKFFGATLVGYTELTANVKKMIYTKPYSAPFLDFVFEDVDQAYETSTKQVIPTKNPLWIVTVMSPCALENIKTVPGPLSSRAATGQASNIVGYAFNHAQGFLGMLGYQCICGTGNGVGATPAFAAMSGCAEASRRTDAVNVDFGMAMRGQKFITDLPLVSTNPIDAGVWKFCQTCKKCADVCPSGAISTESQTTWDVVHPWQALGKKQYAYDALKCSTQRNEFGDECSLCMGACVYSKHASAGVHELVKAVSTNTPIFNGFFKSMDDRFGYGGLINSTNNPVTGVFNDRATEWWNLELPTFGFDLTKPM